MYFDKTLRAKAVQEPKAPYIQHSTAGIGGEGNKCREGPQSFSNLSRQLSKNSDILFSL